MAEEFNFEERIDAAKSRTSEELDRLRNDFRIVQFARTGDFRFAGRGPQDLYKAVEKLLAVFNKERNPEDQVTFEQLLTDGLVLDEDYQFKFQGFIEAGGVTLKAGTFTLEEFVKAGLENAPPIFLSGLPSAKNATREAVEFQSEWNDLTNRLTLDRQSIETLDDQIRVLETRLDNLNSDDVNLQVRSLAGDDPEAVADLLDVDLRIETPDQTAQRNALESYQQRTFSPEEERAPSRQTFTRDPVGSLRTAEPADLPPERMGLDEQRAVFEEGLYGISPDDTTEETDSEEASESAASLPRNTEEAKALRQYLHDTFGGSGAFFFDIESTSLQVGIDKNGNAVSVDSEDRVGRSVHILDYLNDAGIVDDASILGALEQTSWYQNTSGPMREFDAKYGGMKAFLDTNTTSLFQQRTVVGDIVDELNFVADEVLGEDGAKVIGENRMIELAAHILRMGYDDDTRGDISRRRQMLLEVITNENELQTAYADYGELRLFRDSVDQVYDNYNLSVTSKRRDELTEKLFTGEMTADQLTALVRTQALTKYAGNVQIEAALRSGMTMRDYFDPYEAEMSEILGRPVDLMNEFPDILEVASGDGGASRPMTYAEIREYARSLPEWAQSDQGQDSARSLVTAIGTLFGETR